MLLRLAVTICAFCAIGTSTNEMATLLNNFIGTLKRILLDLMPVFNVAGTILEWIVLLW